MAIKLTQRQQQVFDVIRHEIQRTGFPPTRAEIAKTLGFRSANAAEDHLKALARKGAIELIAGTSRGIRLLLDTPTNSTTPLSHTTHSLQSLGAALVNLPIVGRVAAGSPILAAEHIETEIGVAPSMFSQQPDYLLRVRGLSMRDLGILEGDLLAVKRTSEARHGQIVIARLGDDVTVKRLAVHKQHITLEAANPDYADIHVNEHDDFNIEGLAVGLIRNTPMH